MRSLFLALSLVLATGAQATSIRDVRLLYREVPAQSPVPATNLVSIVVYGDGEVVRFDCDPSTPRACATRTLRRYNARQLDQIQDLIDEARHGRIGRAPSTARCIVAPSKTHHFSADNGGVLLMKGHICTSIQENKSPAARRLVSLLNTLRGVQQ